MDVDEMRRRLPAEGFAPFELIAENEYLLEDGKSDDLLVDDASPCECARAGKSCGPDDACVNRTLAVECVPGECSAGSRCQNMRLARRDYADVEVRPAPGKGLGIFARSDIPEDEVGVALASNPHLGRGRFDRHDVGADSGLGSEHLAKGLVVAQTRDEFGDRPVDRGAGPTLKQALGRGVHPPDTL